RAANASAAVSKLDINSSPFSDVTTVVAELAEDCF
ncbi:hypothetical protein J526_3755, partial [Acinetobacter baumannii 1284800]